MADGIAGIAGIADGIGRLEKSMNYHEATGKVVSFTRYQPFPTLAESQLNSKEKSMSSIKYQLRQANRSPEDKLLERHGIINQYGLLTGYGQEQVTNYVFNGSTNPKADLVNDLTAIEAAAAAEQAQINGTSQPKS